MRWYERIKRANAETDQLGRRRVVPVLKGSGHIFTTDDGRRLVSFASNDYLGLASHPQVVQAAHAALDTYGSGAGSARLIVGAREIHRELEAELAESKGHEQALLFPSGYSANVGVLSAFGAEDILICSDELNHASIVDGCRLARARVAVFPHRDLDTLVALLEEHDGPAIVVTDTVFSMDGDVAPVDRLIEICERYDALLILDEAHAVLGPLVPQKPGVNILRVGTLSKFLGSAGGYVTGDAASIEFLTNRARSFIFTTAGTPADAASALAALRILRSTEGIQLVSRLRTLVDRLSPGHPSPIVPFIVGSEAEALAASQMLRERGLLVPAIRPPSVPEGMSRLRVTLSAAHTDEQVDGLVTALSEIGSG
jgi:8-amino-7-oxononanoate synthase